MEDIRTYRDEDEQTRRYEGDDDRRPELTAGANDEEVPFHIPRD